MTRVHLTDRGRQVIERLGAERRDRLGKLLDQLTDEELQAFLIGSRAMRRARERQYAEEGTPS